MFRGRASFCSLGRLLFCHLHILKCFEELFKGIHLLQYSGFKSSLSIAQFWSAMMSFGVESSIRHVFGLEKQQNLTLLLILPLGVKLWGSDSQEGAEGDLVTSGSKAGQCTVPAQFHLKHLCWFWKVLHQLTLLSLLIMHCQWYLHISLVCLNVCRCVCVCVCVHCMFVCTQLRTKRLTDTPRVFAQY